MKSANPSQGTKRPFNLTLSEATVAEARRHTSNLSATVDSLLTEFVAKQTQRAQERQRECDAICDTWNQFRAEHASFADEHCRL
jgi:post-segregation antitoxin (ccd killing protein)